MYALRTWYLRGAIFCCDNVTLPVRSHNWFTAKKQHLMGCIYGWYLGVLNFQVDLTLIFMSSHVRSIFITWSSILLILRVEVWIKYSLPLHLRSEVNTQRLYSWNMIFWIYILYVIVCPLIDIQVHRQQFNLCRYLDLAGSGHPATVLRRLQLCRSKATSGHVVTIHVD